MSRRFIDKTLISRFHQGTCSDAERKEVLLWLEETDDKVLFLDSDRMEDIDERVWSKIKPVSTQQRITQYFLWVGAVTSILYLLVFLYNQQPGSLKTYAFGGTEEKTLDLNGLNFKLLDKGDATVIEQIGAKNGELTFCGVIEIANNTNSDLQYEFNSGCKNSKYTKKNITLKKGKTYIAMYNYYKTDEVLILRKEQMIEYPDLIPVQLKNNLIM